MSEQPIVLSEIDYVRLNQLLAEKTSEHHLEEVLLEADITNCACIPTDLITMNSRISYRRLSDQKLNELTIVYPEHADITRHFVSVLSPLGQAFIGRHRGEKVECELPNGQTAQYEIVDILYQPEAKGDFHL